MVGSSASESAEYDVIIVGASLAGCTAAILLGRAGARVALVEKQPDPMAFKRVCSHFIQASAAPTLERLGLLDEMLAAGALRTRWRAWTRWGWIEPPADQASLGVNLRRERLDPLVREMAATTPGVELLLGRTANRLLREEGVVSGVTVHDRSGPESELRSRLTVGADGRDSRIADLAAVRVKTRPHGRFAYGAYFEGPMPDDPSQSTVWLMDPQWAAAFPTDSGLIFYAAMPTKDRLPQFKSDPEGALVSFLADLPQAPPIREASLVSPPIGKLDMPNRIRVPVTPGLALIGDAALATDPLFGVGCGWAFQSGEWLAESVTASLRGSESLQRGLARYRRRHRQELRGHSFFIHSYATGRRMRPGERLIVAAAARDAKIAATFDAFGTRTIKPTRMFASTMPRAIALQARGAFR